MRPIRSLAPPGNERGWRVTSKTMISHQTRNPKCTEQIFLSLYPNRSRGRAMMLCRTRQPFARATLRIHPVFFDVIARGNAYVSRTQWLFQTLTNQQNSNSNLSQRMSRIPLRRSNPIMNEAPSAATLVTLRQTPHRNNPPTILLPARNS